MRKFVSLFRKRLIEVVQQVGGHTIQASDIFEQTGFGNMIAATEESHETELSSFRA